MRKFVLTDYYDATGETRLAWNMIRYSAPGKPIDDVFIDSRNLIVDACRDAGLVDGDEFTIEIKKTGNRPFGDRKVRQVTSDPNFPNFRGHFLVRDPK
jgi:hypothetical protein